MKEEMRLFVSSSLVIFLLIIGSSKSSDDELSLTGSEAEIVKQLTDPRHYNQLSRPNPREITTVYVHIHVYSLGSIDAQNLRFTAQILLRYRWKDPRLQQENFLQFEGGLKGKIWSPHVYIVNEQESKVMGTSGKDVIYSIQPDGTVVYLARMKVTLQCIMNLQKFPFDSQQCPLIMESWSYNASQLRLLWEDDSPVTVDSHLQLPEYSLEDVIINNSTAQYWWQKTTNMNQHLNVYYGKAAGNFSTLSVHFALQRQYGFYIMDYYVPSVLIVVVSWVTFWLDANSTPGRTVLGTSTLLTFITLSRNIGSSLPKVSYIKSSEIWFIGCTGFIFSSLAEFAFVNIIWRRKKNVDLKKVTSRHILQSTLTPQLYHKNLNLNHSKSSPSISSIDSQYGSSLDTRDSQSRLTLRLDSINPDPFPSRGLRDELVTVTLPVPNLHGPPETKSLFTMTPQEIASWIDRRSRLAFPIAFIIFNCFYWVWSLVLY
uniref:Neurotransmitter-gated ion-channel ligand-binding domain-containing protein n=1 Tax=Graphocephala atropunctata TaxID=36148 RepID=A0A1B6KNL4_9HEMI